MKFDEMQRKVEKFTQDQLHARERRLTDPHLKMSLERTKVLLGEDLKRACGNAVDATWKLTLGAPLKALIEGGKEFGSVVGHNFSVKNPRRKRSYNEVPATMVKELMLQYVKGGIDVAKLAGNLSLALSRATVLGTRYTIGK